MGKPKTKRPNRYTAETPAHRQMEADVAAYLYEHGGRNRGITLFQHKPQTQGDGPVATSTNIWVRRYGRDDWPALIVVECRRDNQGLYSARWYPRPRVNEGLPPMPVDVFLKRICENVVTHLEGCLDLGTRCDPAHVPGARTPIDRRRLAAEAQVRAQDKPIPGDGILAEGAGNGK